MDTPLANEKQLLADIDHLRDQFPQTQELYREVCILLFFRYGMTPTANKLYQLVRKGSMSAPAEALNKFWEYLREKSRVRIEHPDLPDTLKMAAGELTATLWASAQALANESLASFRSESQSLITEAKTSAETAQSERDTAFQSLEKIKLDLESASISIASLTEEMAVAKATNAGLERQLNQARNDHIAQQQQLAGARSDFTSELEKLRAAAQLADERFRASETRALLEIDRERSASTRLQKELETARTAATQSKDRLRSEISTLQGQLGDTRQSTGILEGKLQAALATREAIAADLKAAQSQLADMFLQLSTARADVEKWRWNAEELQRTKTETKPETAKATRTPRKVKVE
jgi:chromosome segregation ATPase